MSAADSTAAIETVFRLEFGRLVSGLARYVGDGSLSEELAQEALVDALEQWQDEGIPRNPGAWLMTVGKRKAIELFRRNETLRRKGAEIALVAGRTEADDATGEDIPDDRLRLIFVACRGGVIPPRFSLVSVLPLITCAADGSTRPTTQGRTWNHPQITSRRDDIRLPRRAKIEVMLSEVVRDGFVAQISGVKPAGSLGDELVDELVEALDNYGVLVFPRTELDETTLVDFGASFGKLEDFGAYSGRLEPRMVRIGNVDDNGNIRAADDRLRAMAAADRLWHVDSSYRKVPARYSMLLAKRVASVGGATEFADTYAAYEALPDRLKKQLEDGVAMHDFHRSRARAGYELSEEERTALPPARQPVVRTNPRTGRVSLYIASHIRQFEGMSTEQSEGLLQELVELATRPERVYSHAWHVGDLVIWDNRSVMHRRAPYDDFAEPRELVAARVLEPAALVA